jgi:hypothetical protein
LNSWSFVHPSPSFRHRRRRRRRRICLLYSRVYRRRPTGKLHFYVCGNVPRCCTRNTSIALRRLPAVPPERRGPKRFFHRRCYVTRRRRSDRYTIVSRSRCSWSRFSYAFRHFLPRVLHCSAFCGYPVTLFTTSHLFLVIAISLPPLSARTRSATFRSIGRSIVRFFPFIFPYFFAPSEFTCINIIFIVIEFGLKTNPLSNANLDRKL